MQLHQLQPITKKKAEKRVGRGGKRGTYSGRGLKGQKARAGRKIRPAIRDYIQKLPKIKGAKRIPRQAKKIKKRKKKLNV
jgi:large subunit ribosomal protein L15